MKYKDSKGTPFREFDLVKLYHYSSGKRKYYMYKWVRMIDGQMVLVHLTDGDGSSVNLRVVADHNGLLPDSEILVGHSSFGYGTLDAQDKRERK